MSAVGTPLDHLHVARQQRGDARGALGDHAEPHVVPRAASAPSTASLRFEHDTVAGDVFGERYGPVPIIALPELKSSVFAVSPTDFGRI